LIDKEAKNEKDPSKNSVNYFVNCSFFDNKNKEIENNEDKKNLLKDSDKKIDGKINLIKEPDSSRLIH
jgi:hypothetical protein